MTSCSRLSSTAIALAATLFLPPPSAGGEAPSPREGGEAGDVVWLETLDLGEIEQEVRFPQPARSVDGNPIAIGGEPDPHGAIPIKVGAASG